MKWIEFLIILLYSVLFASISLNFTIIFLHTFPNRHTDLNRKRIIPIMIFVICVGLTLLYINGQPDSLIALFQGMAFILILSTIAYIDQFSGRIPVFLMILASLFGVMVFVFDDGAKHFIFGGVSNLLISLMIHYFGIRFARKHAQLSEKLTVFGFGDVYGLTAMGFLLGYPDSFWGLLLTMGISLISGMIYSMNQRESFLHMSVQMGFPMFLSGGLLLIYQVTNFNL